MANCTQCGNETGAGEVFCRHCGARLVPASAKAGASPAAVTEDELALFVGKNSDKYLPLFRKFEQQGGDSFSASWHWPAFFFPFWWLIYRKMFSWLLLCLLVGCIPYLGLLAMAGFGVSGNYLYYRHAKKKILGLKDQPEPGPDRAAAIVRAGGVNNAAVVLVPVLAITIAGILAAIAIPQFSEYRRRAADVKAKYEIQEACRIGASIFAEKPGKREIEPDEFLYAGLVRSPEVDMTLLDNRRGTFSISAMHKQGSTLYLTDRQCSLSEERQHQTR